MNSTHSYSIDSDSRRWWWPQAAAGAGAVAAVAAILIAPTTGYAVPEETVRHEAPAVVIDEPRFVRSDDPGARQCFMFRARWNVALDGPQPVCGTSAKPEPPETDRCDPNLARVQPAAPRPPT